MALTGLAKDLRRIANSRAGVMSALEVLVLDRAASALDQDAAARQGAGTETRPTPPDSADLLRELGIAVRVGTLVPTGPAVRLEVDDVAKWLEPHEAHELAAALNECATYAVHEDRAARRTRGVTS